MKLFRGLPHSVPPRLPTVGAAGRRCSARDLQVAGLGTLVNEFALNWLPAGVGRVHWRSFSAELLDELLGQ